MYWGKINEKIIPLTFESGVVVVVQVDAAVTAADAVVEAWHE
jgi:hypothetical protein